jgi:putative nucleotidyltransferase with HDIG domain
MRKVPSPPTIYFQIVKELQSPAASMENIGAIISQDMAVTAKLLQMVNSAAFGLHRPVSSPAEAVMYLGIETTKSLVLLAHTYSHFDRIPPSIFSVDALWRHSLSTGRLARAIARSERVGEDLADQSFTAGLLHDMGKLVLAANQPDRYALVPAQVQKAGSLIWRVEQDIFGTTHAEVGAWLAERWNLPVILVEAIRHHQHPEECPRDPELALLVYLGDYLSGLCNLGKSGSQGVKALPEKVAGMALRILSLSPESLDNHRAGLFSEYDKASGFMVEAA